MQLHELQPNKRKSKKRKGRGKKHGMYSGRGIKGQKARAGKKLQPAIRRFVKRYPKKRGYRFKSLKNKPEIVNVGQLNQIFKDGEKVNPAILVEKGILRKTARKLPSVKVLGNGQINRPLTIENCLVSDTAKVKIEKAGGKVMSLAKEND